MMHHQTLIEAQAQTFTPVDDHTDGGAPMTRDENNLIDEASLRCGDGSGVPQPYPQDPAATLPTTTTATPIASTPRTPSDPFTPPSRRSSCDDDELDDQRLSNVFVCMMPQWMTDADLARLFAPFGPIESAKVMLNIHTGKSRGIAFVKYASARDAQQAIKALDGHIIGGDGNRLGVRIANAKAAYQPGPPTNKVFVRNVPDAISHDRLLQYFSQFGGVLDVSILQDTAASRKSSAGVHQEPNIINNNENKIAFVTFASVDSAAKAADATHTATPFEECGSIPLLAKVAEASSRRIARISRRDPHTSTPVVNPSSIQFPAQLQQQQPPVVNYVGNTHNAPVPIRIVMEAPQRGVQQQPPFSSGGGPMIVPQQLPTWQGQQQQPHYRQQQQQQMHMTPQPLVAFNTTTPSSMYNAPNSFHSTGGHWVQVSAGSGQHQTPQVASPQAMMFQHSSGPVQQQHVLANPTYLFPQQSGGLITTTMTHHASSTSSSAVYGGPTGYGPPYGSIHQPQQQHITMFTQPLQPQQQQQQSLPISFAQGDGNGAQPVFVGSGGAQGPTQHVYHQVMSASGPSSSTLHASQNNNIIANPPHLPQQGVPPIIYFYHQ